MDGLPGGVGFEIDSGFYRRGRALISCDKRIRVSRPSQGFVMGYQLTFRNGRMILKKMNYGQNEVASAPLDLVTGSSMHIAVDVSGATMKVYLNDSKKPALEWTDA